MTESRQSISGRLPTLYERIANKVCVGIQTERGNINREIIKNNMLLEQAKEMLMLAKQELHSAQYAKIKNTAVSVKNEVMEMIAKVRERKGRLDLPIVSGKHLRRISDRTALQSADNAEKFIVSYNQKNLERELQNESRQHNRQQSKTKQREEEI